MGRVCVGADNSKMRAVLWWDACANMVVCQSMVVCGRWVVGTGHRQSLLMRSLHFRRTYLTPQGNRPMNRHARSLYLRARAPPTRVGQVRAPRGAARRAPAPGCSAWSPPPAESSPGAAPRGAARPSPIPRLSPRRGSQTSPHAAAPPRASISWRGGGVAVRRGRQIHTCLLSRFLISSLRRAESLPVPAALAGAAAGAPCPGLGAPDMVAKLSRKQRQWTARDSRSCRYSLVFLSMSSTHRPNRVCGKEGDRSGDTSRRARRRSQA